MSNTNVNINAEFKLSTKSNKILYYINCGFVGLFVILTLLMKFGVIPNKEFIQFIPMFIFAFVHGSQKYGAKNMGIWFVITWIVSNFFEGLSISIGFPFGNYHYTMGGPRIWNVPVLIMVAYFAIVYTSWIAALAVTNHLNKKIEGIYKFTIPLTAAIVMTMWDLITDPKASTLKGSWVWKDGGAFYGVPISNFIGWVFVVYVFLQIFTLYISVREVKAENIDLTTTKSYWVQPCIVYLFMGLGIVIDGITHATNVEIYASAGMISIFTMVFTAYIGFLNIKNSKELS